MASVSGMEFISSIPSSKGMLKTAVESESATPESSQIIDTEAKCLEGNKVSGSTI